MNDNALDDRRDAEEDIPTWLKTALRTAAGENVAFSLACLDSADLAVSLLKLRQANARMGTPLLAVPEFLRGLGAVAQVPLDPILRWAGLKGESSRDSGFATAWGKIAPRLGLSVREALLHLRLTFAGEMGVEVLPAMASARNGVEPQSALAQCEEFLARESLRWNDDVLQRLRRGEHVLRETYRNADRLADAGNAT